MKTFARYAQSKDRIEPIDMAGPVRWITSTDAALLEARSRFLSRSSPPSWGTLRFLTVRESSGPSNTRGH